MYNSSIKGQSKDIHFKDKKEISGKIFYNDMSKNSFREEFTECDVIYSEIAWAYGYSRFNEKAENLPDSYSSYMNNINKLIEKLKVPSFIVCGKPAKAYFKNADSYPIKISTSGTNMTGCTLYVWNYKLEPEITTTKDLIKLLSQKFRRCLDFSCGYGEHLLNFTDFVACDINKDCLTYLSILFSERELENGKTTN